MRLSRKSRQLIAFLVLGWIVGTLVTPAFAQPDDDEGPKLSRSERREQARIYREGGFRGLTPEEAQEAQAVFNEGLALEKKGKWSAALGKYKRVYHRYPRSAAAPDAYYQTGQIMLQKGNLPKAFEAFDAIVRAYPDYGKFNELISEEYRIAYELVKGRRGRILGILPGFANRDRGVQYFARLVANAPYSDYAPLALMNVAETYIDQGQPEAAIATLDHLITNYPNSIVTSDGYLRMAQVYEKLVDGPLYDQTSTQESIEHYEDFLILFPHDPNVGDAETGLARMKEMKAMSRMKMADFYYFKRSRYEAARVFYNEAITIAPTSEVAERARQRLAALEVDEARNAARIAARGEDNGSRLFGLFRKKKQVEPIVPNDQSVTGTPATGTGTPQPSAEASTSATTKP